jgi:hypothetical protein
MKLGNWALSLSFFVALTLSAGSVFAQDDQGAPPDPALQSHLRAQLFAAQAANRGASAARKSQSRLKSDAASPDATQTCTYTFTSGSGTTYLKFCVTVNGNIAQFESPSGVEQIDQGGTPLEGYGICDLTTSVAYYDYAGEDSGNWGSPTTVSYSATSVKIERTTSDGAWTLTQTISSAAGISPYAKVIMALKNNSGEGKEAILLRYFSPVPDNAGSTGNYNENFDASFDSAWGYFGYSTASPYGMMIQNVGNPTPASVPYGRSGLAQNTFKGPAPCNWTAMEASPVINNVGSSYYVYFFEELNKGQTVTVTDKYFSF